MAESQNREGGERRSKRRLQPHQSTHKTKYKTGPFTDEEKELILSALYIHGTNVDKIVPLIPSRSREQVRDFLTAWYRRVRKVPVVLSEKDHKTTLIKEPVETWLDKMRKETQGYLAETEGNSPTPWFAYALGYIAKYENHPQVSETNGVDFRKLYEFLETMLQGNATKTLNFADSLFLLSSLKRLKKRLERIEFHKDEVHLKRQSTLSRTYKRFKVKEEVLTETPGREMEAFLLSKSVNPLGMPIETLSIKERLKTQTNFQGYLS